jgi:hypothetical protein
MGSANSCSTCLQVDEDTNGMNDFTLFPKAMRCFRECPVGSYKTDGVCMPCKDNVLNCDQTTGNSITSGMSIPCDQSCSTCFWNSAYCLGCATGMMRAPGGRCVKECPADTTEETMAGSTMKWCKPCSDGCLKCVKETNNCSKDGSEMINNTTVTAMAKCLRCDKDLGFSLYRGHCVKRCPHGTYSDKLTGWCAPCDCNCGNGGCVDKNTCLSCPMKGMMLDKESGRCKCDVDVTAKFSEDWSMITFIIDSTNVEFRNPIKEMEGENKEINMKKICRIGNEHSIFDHQNSTDVKIDDLQTERCGNQTNTKAELMMIMNEFGMTRKSNSSTTDEFAADVASTNPSTKGTGETKGPAFNGQNEQEMGEGMSGNGTSTERQTIEPDSKTCPAQQKQVSKDDLEQMGMDAEMPDILKHIKSLGSIFGNIPDSMMNEDRSPKEGLMFTKMPQNICALLFNDETRLEILRDPKCEVWFTDSNTIIKVMLPKGALVHKDFVLKVQPNVFVKGCDWPIVNVVMVADGAEKDDMEVKIKKEKMNASSCKAFEMGLESQNSVGNSTCSFGIDKVLDSNEDPITTAAVMAIIKEINGGDSMTLQTSVKIKKEHMEALYQAGARFIVPLGKCSDSLDQEQVVQDLIPIMSQDEGISMENEIKVIVYNPQEENNKVSKPNFKFSSCEGGNNQVNYTATLKVKTGAETWQTVSEIGTDMKLPTDLDCTMTYKVVFTATSGDEEKTFGVPIVCRRMKPKVNTSKIQKFMIPSEVNTITFAKHHFNEVVENLEDASFGLSFDCSTCDSDDSGATTCMDQDGAAIDFDSMYMSSNFTLTIPADKFIEDSCYKLYITVTYMGEESTTPVKIQTAGSDVNKTIPIDFNKGDGKPIDISEAGSFSCAPKNSTNNKRAENISNITMTLMDGSGNDLTQLACVHVSDTTPEISYDAGCLPEDTDIIFSCNLQKDGDSTSAGMGEVTVTSDSDVDFSFTISPESGNHLTEFTITVTSEYDDTLKCRFGYIDTAADGGFVPRTATAMQVSAGESASFNPTRLPVDANYQSTKVAVRCRNTDGDQRTRSLDVAIIRYKGEDLSDQLAEIAGQLEEYASELSGEEIADEIIQTPELADHLGDAQAVLDKLQLTIDELNTDKPTAEEIDTTLNILDAWSTIIMKNGIENAGVEQFEQLLNAIFGEDTAASGRRLAESSTGIEDIKSKRPKQGSDSVKVLGSGTTKKIVNNIDKYISGVQDHKSKMTKCEYEDMRKTFMVYIDKLIKTMIGTIVTGESKNMPKKNFYVYVERLSLLDDDMDKVNTIEYECPCGSEYVQTVDSTDEEASTTSTTTETMPSRGSRSKDAKSSTGKKHEASGGEMERKTAEGQCYVSLPPMSSISSYTSGCTSVAVSVVTTKNMCPNAELSESEEETLKECPSGDGTSELTAISDATKKTEYNVDAIENAGASTCDTNSYTDMKCTGSSIEISYYCVEDETIDSTTGEFTIKRLEIGQIDGAYVEYSMNCPAAKDSFESGQEETAVFVDESSGENSCNGCGYNSETGTIQCVHFTSFGYSKSTKDSSAWEKRIYENFILYVILVLDFYFIAVALFALLRKDKKTNVKVFDQSIAHNKEIEMGKDQRVEVASNEDNSHMSKADDDGLHKKGF